MKKKHKFQFAIWLLCLTALLIGTRIWSVYLKYQPTFRNDALIEAVERGHTPAVQRLLAQGADANAIEGSDADFPAIEFSAQLLGIPIQRDKGNETALMQAAQAGDPAIVQLLLNAGANVQARNRHGRTALQFAAGSGLPNSGVIILLLVQHGSDLKTAAKF